jgi:D-inositol-3-phosphate glycosyltransferase
VAALEAMGAGRPVVATRVGGLSESVLDGVSGFLVPPQDPAALAAAIAKLARSRALGQAMGGRGRKRAREYFSLQRMALQNESYYRELLSMPS